MALNDQNKLDIAVKMQQLLREKKRALVAIDGLPGSGKTGLGKALSVELGVPCVHIDDYLDPHQSGFLEHLDFDALRAATEVRPVLVEGVCNMAVLSRLGIEPDFLVYLDGITPEFSRAAEHPLSHEISDYNAHYQPASRADMLASSDEAIESGVQQMNTDRTQVDIAFIQAKTKLSLALAAGGMLTLLVGLFVLIFGAKTDDQTMINVLGLEASASGIGGVIMLTSVIWAFVAYKARPTYAQSRQMVEKYDSDAQLLERIEHESSTMIAVAPPRTPIDQRD